MTSHGSSPCTNVNRRRQKRQVGRKIKRSQHKQKLATAGVIGNIRLTKHPKNRVNKKAAKKLAKRQKIFTSRDALRNPKLAKAIGENLVGSEDATEMKL